MTEPMTIHQITDIARVHGEDIASNILAEVPDIDSESFGDGLSESQVHFRQYSPFEFYAAGINAREELYEGGAEDGWEAYESAFDSGVRSAVQKAGRPDLV